MTKNKNLLFRTVHIVVTIALTLHILYAFTFLINHVLSGDNEFTLRGTISLIQENWQPEKTELNENYTATFLPYHSGFIRFDYKNWNDAFTKDSILFLFFEIIWLFVGLGITFLLYKITKTIRKTPKFQLKNIFRMRIIALFIILLPISEYCSKYFFSSFAQNNISLPNYVIATSQAPDFFRLPYPSYFVVGLLIFIIAEIYKEGNRIQTENELTV